MHSNINPHINIIVQNKNQALRAWLYQNVLLYSLKRMQIEMVILSGLYGTKSFHNLFLHNSFLFN